MDNLPAEVVVVLDPFKSDAFHFISLLNWLSVLVLNLCEGH